MVWAETLEASEIQRSGLGEVKKVGCWEDRKRTPDSMSCGLGMGGLLQDSSQCALVGKYGFYCPLGKEKVRFTLFAVPEIWNSGLHPWLLRKRTHLAVSTLNPVEWC